MPRAPDIPLHVVQDLRVGGVGAAFGRLNGAHGIGGEGGGVDEGAQDRADGGDEEVAVEGVGEDTGVKEEGGGEGGGSGVDGEGAAGFEVHWDFWACFSICGGRGIGKREGEGKGEE